MKSKLKILFVVAECSPLIKVGGLADVAGELPIKLKGLGADISIVIPGNNSITAQTQYKDDFPVEMGWRKEACILRQVINAPVDTYIIDNYHYFDRKDVYGHNDDAERFAFFTKAVFQMILRMDSKPDVLHLNDWHTAPLAMLIRENEHNFPELSDISILYTIHNLEYQGISGKDIFRLFSVRDSVFVVDKVEYYDLFNAMKTGINYADVITTVSKTFSKDILTPEFGFGLDGVLRNRTDFIKGVTNGLDICNWDPETDKAIYFNYSKSNPSAKKKNKTELKKELGLDNAAMTDAPLFSVISRLACNKGIDIMPSAFENILKNGYQLIILGSGEKYYERIFTEFAQKYPGQVSVNIEFDADKARRIFAGSDFLLMPSRYEPCGISQLIAMRYGTIPIVHRVGGLAETVIDEFKYSEQGTGFSFVSYSEEAFKRAINKAMRIYNDNKAWAGIIKRAMNTDFSWDGAAAEYLSSYKDAKIINDKRKNGGRVKIEEKRKGKNNTK